MSSSEARPSLAARVRRVEQSRMQAISEAFELASRPDCTKESTSASRPTSRGVRSRPRDHREECCMICQSPSSRPPSPASCRPSPHSSPSATGRSEWRGDGDNLLGAAIRDGDGHQHRQEEVGRSRCSTDLVGWRATVSSRSRIVAPSLIATAKPTASSDRSAFAFRAVLEG